MAPGQDPSGVSGATRMLELAAEPSAPSRARAELRAFLDGAPVDQAVLYDVQLLVSELVTNAVRHGSDPGDCVEVVYERQGRQLRVSVSDVGRAEAPPTVREHSLDRVSGRGLRAVAQLSEHWAAESRGGRCAVWFTVQLERPAMG
jgi:anti-sigma regulatory factor (Ser/Thr protein kinase)